MCTTFDPGVYIVVHGGAGTHSHSNEARVKKTLKLACSTALKNYVRGEATALHAVVTAITSLEDDPNLNAAYGSNLTLNGTVECDAAVMDGVSGDFGSVGAVSGIKNPIQLALSILRYSQESDPLGRVPPLTLVSEGARVFAAQRNVPTVSAESLITQRAKEEWYKWTDRLEKAQQGVTDNSSDPEIANGLRLSQDTVGAVACGSAGGIAAGVSSGGILLKHPGRVGEAAMLGAGCWAQWFKETNSGIACSVSGTGEYIARSTLARTIGEAFERCTLEHLEPDPHDIIDRILFQKFVGPCQERGILGPDVGVLLLTTELTRERMITRMWCAFTTPSMSIAYASFLNPKPKAVILRHPLGESQSTNHSRIFTTAISL